MAGSYLPVWRPFAIQRSRPHFHRQDSSLESPVAGRACTSLAGLWLRGVLDRGRYFALGFDLGRPPMAAYERSQRLLRRTPRNGPDRVRIGRWGIRAFVLARYELGSLCPIKLGQFDTLLPSGRNVLFESSRKFVSDAQQHLLGALHLGRYLARLPDAPNRATEAARDPSRLRTTYHRT